MVSTAFFVFLSTAQTLAVQEAVVKWLMMHVLVVLLVTLLFWLLHAAAPSIRVTLVAYEVLHALAAKTLLRLPTTTLALWVDCLSLVVTMHKFTLVADSRRRCEKKRLSELDACRAATAAFKRPLLLS